MTNEKGTSHEVPIEEIENNNISSEIPSDEIIENNNEKISSIKSSTNIKKEEYSSVNELVQKLKAKSSYEEVFLPSRCLCYEDLGLKSDQPIHVRPMTISEEKILATPRLTRSGQAIDKILEACIKEDIDTNKLFVSDRMFLLFYIRGISYGTLYEVNVKCPSCNESFDEDIDLDQLALTRAEDDFVDNKKCTLPNSELDVWYRQPRGEDEKFLQRYRNQMTKGFGGDFVDNTIVKRNTLLINKIAKFTVSTEIEQIINNLPAMDSNFLRDKFNNPPFGMDTNIHLTCAYCSNEWEIDLPLEANFFFPRTK